MNYNEEIIKKIKHMSGKFSTYELFNDWTEMYALSIANLMNIGSDIWNYREKQYLRIAHKYTKDELENFLILNDLLINALNVCKEDVLGYVFTTLQINSKVLGQVFTPPSIGAMMAALTFDIDKIINDKQIDFYEPACGSGVMIISAANHLYKNGLNYQKILHVIAQDIDLKCIYMTYIQCSLLGIQAEIVHGDSIASPYPFIKYPEHEVFKTPMYYLRPVLFSNDDIFLA